MAHFIPTLRTAVRPAYIPPTMWRKSEIQASKGDPAAPADFLTVLKNQSPAAATASVAAVPPATLPPATVPPATVPPPAAPATPPGSIGTMSPWSPTPVVAPPAATTSPMAPTAQSLFGANPWSTDAGGTGPNGSYSYNNYYFATPATANKVAQMLGGTVVAQDAITPYGPFVQNQPNQMVQMPDGKLINAGLVAGFYDHGYTQQAVDQMIAGELSGKLV